MSADLVLVLALLAAVVTMFVIDRPRMDAVGLIVALPLTGVITMEEALAGFSDGNIVLIAALFVIGEGLVRTGIDWVALMSDAPAARHRPRVAAAKKVSCDGQVQP